MKFASWHGSIHLKSSHWEEEAGGTEVQGHPQLLLQVQGQLETPFQKKKK